MTIIFPSGDEAADGVTRAPITAGSIIGKRQTAPKPCQRSIAPSNDEGGKRCEQDTAHSQIKSTIVSRHRNLQAGAHSGQSGLQSSAELRASSVPIGMNGGRDWDRTSDPCDVNAVLIPLSYAPDRSGRLLYRVGPLEGNPSLSAAGQAASIRSTSSTRSRKWKGLDRIFASFGA